MSAQAAIVAAGLLGAVSIARQLEDGAMARDNQPDQDLDVLARGAAALGIALDERQLGQFARFRELLLEWNERVNLTSITDPGEVVTRHLLDSLTCVLALPVDARRKPLKLLDVGSGAGFPGLALAVAFPRWRVTSLEATGKKVRFQQVVIEAMELGNTRAVAGRAEELGRKPDWRARFDVVTARALAALPTLLEYCAPFVRVGATIVAPKKGELAEEIAAGARAAGLLGAQLLPPVPVGMPPLDDGRVLLVARQKRPCPSQYPRAAGAPVKRPLGSGQE
jgi:16S rRNA (guanine527-N7)-methyltransferase